MARRRGQGRLTVAAWSTLRSVTDPFLPSSSSAGRSRPSRPSASRSSKRPRPPPSSSSIPSSSRKEKEPRARAPKGELSIWSIDSIEIEGLEFRSQRLLVPSRSRGKGVVDGAAHMRARKSSEVNEWWSLTRPSSDGGRWEKDSLALEAEGTRLLKSVRHTFAREPTIQSLFVDVMTGFSSGMCVSLSHPPPCTPLFP